MQGKIIKGVAGFYYVDVNNIGVIECKARGVFRKSNITPLIGDNVIIEIDDNQKGYIKEILPRRNELVRPTVSNIDQAIIVFAIKNPMPNLSLLDRFLILAKEQNIDVIICFNKVDLVDKEEEKNIAKIYKLAGYKVIIASALKGEGKDIINNILLNKTTVFAGPSGVGKSSLLNMIDESFQLKTGEISEKIKRGKHTTRHAELITLDDGGYVVDTPGFSSITLFHIPYDDLSNYYIEFNEYEQHCKFSGCSHIHEPQCGVKEAVKNGEISDYRYNSYVMLYNEIKEYQDRNRWR